MTTDADGTGHVNIALGEDVGCQVVNTAQPSHLSLDKDARANGTGTTLGDNDWTLAFDGPDAGSGAGGVASTRVGIGSYTLTETGPTAGWTAGAWTCGDHSVTTDADGVGHLDIALGENVSCSIVNTAMRPGLTLLKKVDGNGTGAETYTPDTSWTLHADLVGNESPGGRDLRHRRRPGGDRGRGPGRHLHAQRVRRTRPVDHGRLGLHRRQGQHRAGHPRHGGDRARPGRSPAR